jgi:hypothetical protein
VFKLRENRGIAGGNDVDRISITRAQNKAVAGFSAGSSKSYTRHYPTKVAQLIGDGEICSTIDLANSSFGTSV